METKVKMRFVMAQRQWVGGDTIIPETHAQIHNEKTYLMSLDEWVTAFSDTRFNVQDKPVNIVPQPDLIQNTSLGQKVTYWFAYPGEKQNYLQNGLIHLYFFKTQPPRLWGFCLTRNLGGFFVPAVLARSTSTGKMQ